MRVGVPGSIGERIKKITLESQAERLHCQKVASMDSPESFTIQTMEEETKNLAKQKQQLTSSIKIASLVFEESINLCPNRCLQIWILKSQNGQTDERRLYGRKLEDLESQIEKVEASLRDARVRHTSHFDRERYGSKEEILSTANVICSTLNSCRNKDMERVFIK